MTYRRPADRAGALRLHLNENTGGCSAAVLEAIRADFRRRRRILSGLHGALAGLRGVSRRPAKRSSC